MVRLSRIVCGVDLGGTQTKIGIVDEQGEIILKRIIETRVGDRSETIVSRIAETISSVIKEVNVDRDTVLGVGIGSPGSIDRENGVVLFSPNFPNWRNMELKRRIEEKTGLKTFLENDANAFILGEWAFGEHAGCDHMIGITLGTGIGGGVIAAGKLLIGADGFGGELGHIIVEPDGPTCGCGSHGCVESIASAPSIGRLAKEMRKRFPNSKMFESGPQPSTKQVFQAATQGDEAARLVLERVYRALSLAIGNYIHIFNPRYVVLGGGVSRAGEPLLNGIRKCVERFTMSSFKGTYEIILSQLFEDAGIKGAASIVFYKFS
ncbi:MAG TPA: ROK family protein [Kosmotogaceae bacterium]|nr:MAG: ROK family protein [Thermotogales bacterium 46_20]HAA85063.1 ROK family protein [Kosmotogaceae bacterium]